MSQKNYQKKSSPLPLAITAIAVAAGLAALLVFSPGAEKSAGEYLTPASSFRDAHGLAVDAADESKVYIASHNGLYLLKDDKELFLVGEGRDDYMGFSTHPTDANTFFTSGHPAFGGNLGFQKSTDGARTWKKISNGLSGPVDFHAMAVDRIDSSIIYGIHRGMMQRSSDGGESWQLVEGAPEQIIQLSASPVTKGTLFAATGSGLKVSRDQGATWSNAGLSGEVVMAVAVQPTDEKSLLASTQEGYMKSSDGGATWLPFTLGDDREGGMYIAYAPKSPKVIYTLTSSLSLFKSVNGGSSWDKIR